MKAFLTQLKWQFFLLRKNNIISISLGVTFIYGLFLFFLKNANDLDALLVSSVLLDPTVIGYFFVGLSIYSEINNQILPAIFTTPLNVHVFLLSKTISISVIGLACSLGMAISVKGLYFDVFYFIMGSMGLCLISTLLGLIMLTFANEFLKFTMISIPVFLIFFTIPILQYLGIVDMGFMKYLFPIQGSLDLIDTGVSGTGINYFLAYTSIIITIPLFYWFAFQRFSKKVVHQ